MDAHVDNIAREGYRSVTDHGVHPDEDDLETSSSLLWHARADEAPAWRELVDLYHPLVYKWCRQHGLQEADALDVGQEVFRAVARGLQSYRHDRPEDTFRGWLRIITRNKIRDYTRRRSGEQSGLAAFEAKLARTAHQGSTDDGQRADVESARLVYRQALKLVQATVRGEFGEQSW